MPVTEHLGRLARAVWQFAEPVHAVIYYAPERRAATDALLALMTFETPPEYRAPGTWMHDALEVRDRWESRLLRTTGWSPLS